MTLKSRLFFSFFAMVALNIGLGTILISSSWSLRSRYIAYEKERQIMDWVRQLSVNFEKQRRLIDEFMIGVESQKKVYEEVMVENDQLLKLWGDKITSPSEKDEFNKTNYQLASLKANLLQVFQLVEGNRRMEAVQTMESTVLSEMDGFDKKLKAIIEGKKTQSEYYWSSAKKLATRATVYSLMLLVSVVIVGVGLSVMLYQSVSQPLAKLREGVKKIGSGDLNLKLDIKSPPELAELAHSFEDMAQSLKKLQTQIVQMDRMSAVGTLAGGVAHEINNPLTGVLGQAQLLLSKMDLEDPRRSNVQKVERAAQRCRKIVRGLLDFSRPQEYLFEPAEIDPIIQSAISLCETEITASGIQVIWDKGPEMPKILASSHHLQQVFLNLVTNAMHAMPTGGSLTIQKKLTQSSGISSSLTKPLPNKEYVEISFIDTGIGIDREHISHIFDPFFTTKEPGKGTGLGLSISYGIIQQHQGNIEVRSKGKGHGTTFSIYLPTA